MEKEMEKEFEEHARKRGFKSVEEMRKYFFDKHEGVSFLLIKNAFAVGYKAEKRQVRK